MNTPCTPRHWLRQALRRRSFRRQTDGLLDANGTSGGLLPGAAAGSQTDALGLVLAAASAPGDPGELRNEAAALAMFHSARLDSLSDSRRDTMKYTPARSFAAKTIAGGVAVVTFASAGVALAATGNLPVDGPGNGWGLGLQKDEPEEIEPVEEETTDDEVVDEETTEDELAEEADGDDAEEATETPRAFNGLCRAFSVGNKDTQGNALEAAPFLALIEAAGGVENVEVYCEPILAEKSGKPETDESTDTENPSTEKSQKGKAKKAKKDRPEHPRSGDDTSDDTGDDTP